jgi:YVTN family beta-propeller protein
MTTKRSVLAAGPIAAALLAAGIPAAVLGLSGPSSAVQHPQATARTIAWLPTHGGASLHAALARMAAKHASDRADYLAYVAFAGGDEVVQADVTSDSIIGTIPADTGEGVAVTPDDSTVYIAETGQYYVLAYDPSTRKSASIEVGAYPQDVAIAPDGNVVYATVTGGDTGPGGSDEVAVISTATNTVTSDIRVGTAPRQVVFSPDGDYAYVSTENGVYVIDVTSSSVVRVFHAPFSDRQGPQGIAVSADGKTLYATYPAANAVWELNAATGAPQGVTTAGDEAYAVTAAGTSLYVADMNDDKVSVVSTVTGKVTGTIAVGRLPMSIATTPDGSQVWVGNGLSGSISVISVASGTVTATISGGPGTSPLDAAPLGIAFARPPS